MLRTVVLVLIAYLSGSIPMGVLVARVSGGTDPRTVGSGRTGAVEAAGWAVGSCPAMVRGPS